MTTKIQVDHRLEGSPLSLSIRKYRGAITKTISLLILLLIWGVASLLIPANIMPGPIAVFGTLYKNFLDGVLTTHFLITMQRVILGFMLAMLIGIFFGVIIGISKRIEQLMSLWMVILLAIPSLCYLVVAYVVLGLNEFATIVAITITAFPPIAINVWQGVHAVDNKLLDMARVFNFSAFKRFRLVIFPQILPYVVASARSSLGLVWKIVVIAELLGRTSGIGFQLNYWFQLFNMQQVFAWTLFATIIVVIIELVIFNPIEKKLFHWRPDTKL